jgi:hypothetical protein
MEIDGKTGINNNKEKKISLGGPQKSHTQTQISLPPLSKAAVRFLSSASPFVLPCPPQLKTRRRR